MINAELIEYVRGQLSRQVSAEEVKRGLIANGWSVADVQEAFNTVGTQKEPSISISIQDSKENLPVAKKRIWVKVLLSILLIIILIVAGLAVFSYKLATRAGHDIPPIDDSDLTLQTTNVPDADNSYFDLIKIDEKIIVPENASSSSYISNMVSGKVPWDEKLVQEIESENKEAFIYFDSAANKLKYQDVNFAEVDKVGPETPLPKMNPWRYLSSFSAVKAVSLARQGKDVPALDEAFKSIRVGQQLTNSQSVLIEYLVGNAMKHTGLSAVQQILSLSSLRKVNLKKYIDELDQYQKNEDGLVNAWKFEYRIQSNTIDRATSNDSEFLKAVAEETKIDKEKLASKLRNSFYFEANKTKLLLADGTREKLKSSTGNCVVLESSDEKPTNIDFIEILNEENSIGNIVYRIVHSNLNGVILKKCQETVMVRATQTLLGIKAYKNDTSKYPNSLDELVPKYLSAVPKDPFDGNNIKYLPEKKIIYSVGKDGKDDNGISTDDLQTVPDITFTINF